MRWLWLLLLLCPGVVHAQTLPMLSGDATNPSGFFEMPFSALTEYPSECSTGFLMRGIIDGGPGPTTDALDCVQLKPGELSTTGAAPTDGQVCKYDAATGKCRWAACSGKIVVKGPDYVYLAGKLLFYNGS